MGADFISALFGSLEEKLEKRHATEEEKKKQRRSELFKIMQDPGMSDETRAKSWKEYQGTLSPETKKRSSALGEIFQKLHPPKQQQGQQPITSKPIAPDVPREQGLSAKPGEAGHQNPSFPRLQAPQATTPQESQPQQQARPAFDLGSGPMSSEDLQKRKMSEQGTMEEAANKRRLDFERKANEQTSTINREQGMKTLDANLRQIDEDKSLSAQEKHQARLALYGVHEAAAPSLQRVHVKGEDGKWKPAEFNPKTGVYQSIDGTPIPSPQIKDVSTTEPPSPDSKDSQEVRDLTGYYEGKGMEHSAARQMALKDRKKQLDTREKGAEIRVTMAGQEAADAAAFEKQKKQAAGKVYVSGGPSLVNPTGNQSIEIGAWEYINSGHLPFTGFGSGKKGYNARELMLARAGELLADLGLTPSDLPAVRGKIKGDTAALSRVTTMGAMIEQFEGTLERNLQVAKKLSDAWQRGDIRFINRVAGAFKTGKGDAEALNLAAQLHGVAREWGKIMQGSVSAAGVQVSEANAADVFFSKGISNGQLVSLFENVIRPDMKNRSEAIQAEKDKLVLSLKRATNLPALSAPTTAATAKELEKSSPQVVRTKQEYDALPSGTEYIGPSGRARKP